MILWQIMYACKYTTVSRKQVISFITGCNDTTIVICLDTVILEARDRAIPYEPQSKKTGGFRFPTCLTQTRLCSYRRWIEAWNFGFKKKRNCTTRVVKRNALISFAVLWSWSAPLFSHWQKSLFLLRGSYGVRGNMTIHTPSSSIASMATTRVFSGTVSLIVAV